MKTLPEARLINNISGLQGIVSKENSHLFNMFFEIPYKTIDLDAFIHQKKQLDKDNTPFCVELTDEVELNIHSFFKSQDPTFTSVSTRLIHDINTFVSSNKKVNSLLSAKMVRNDQDITDWLYCFDLVWPQFGDTRLAFQKWFHFYGVGEEKDMQNLVFFEDGKPVGIATLHFFAGVVGPFSIAVIPAKQKAGIGQFILEELAMIITNLKYQYVVGQGSEEGLKLYKKADIQILGQTTRYYFN